MAHRAVFALVITLLVGGCESTHEHLLAQGYPAPYADGFDDGCGSGRQAAGAITVEFRKNALRFQKEALYAQGWGDGFQQCRLMAESREREQYEEQRGNDRDRAWQEQKDRALGRALRGD
ncbi:MAG: hypothetical protein GAK43_01558 [Stenotrophomonas maltophilia]|nr:MAG: hypothetical protein GAK43_01558 [Stenotrophomonas maltophilia]